MKKPRKHTPKVPAGYMDALARLCGKPPSQGPKSAPQRTQADGVLPMQHKERKS